MTPGTRVNKFAGGAVKNQNTSNKALAKELHKLIVKKVEKRKVYSSFIDNIWGANLGDTQLISKFNEEIRFLSYVINISSKNTWTFL